MKWCSVCRPLLCWTDTDMKEFFSLLSCLSFPRLPLSPVLASNRLEAKHISAYPSAYLTTDHSSSSHTVSSVPVDALEMIKRKTVINGLEYSIMWVWWFLYCGCKMDNIRRHLLKENACCNSIIRHWLGYLMVKVIVSDTVNSTFSFLVCAFIAVWVPTYPSLPSTVFMFPTTDRNHWIIQSKIIMSSTATDRTKWKKLQLIYHWLIVGNL